MITESLCELSVNTDTIGAENDDVTDTFSVLLYHRTTKLGNIKGVRKELFTRRGTFAHENLASDKKYHSKDMPNVQSGHVRGQSMCPQMRLPNPTVWC